jgi:hypothetical protein
MHGNNLLGGRTAASSKLESGAARNASGLTTGQMKISKVWVRLILSNIG